MRLKKLCLALWGIVILGAPSLSIVACKNPGTSIDIPANSLSRVKTLTINQSDLDVAGIDKTNVTTAPPSLLETIIGSAATRAIKMQLNIVAVINVDFSILITNANGIMILDAISLTINNIPLKIVLIAAPNSLVLLPGSKTRIINIEIPMQKAPINLKYQPSLVQINEAIPSANEINVNDITKVTRQEVITLIEKLVQKTLLAMNSNVTPDEYTILIQDWNEQEVTNNQGDTYIFNTSFEQEPLDSEQRVFEIKIISNDDSRNLIAETQLLAIIFPELA